MQRIGKKHGVTLWQGRGRSAAARCWWADQCEHSYNNTAALRCVLTQCQGGRTSAMICCCPSVWHRLQGHFKHMPANLREQNFIHNDDRMMENTFTLAYCCWRNSNKLLMSTDPTLRPTKDQICRTDKSSDCMCHCYQCLWKCAHKFQILANLTDAGLQCDALKPCQPLKH